jgi:hypothetical protein
VEASGAGWERISDQTVVKESEATTAREQQVGRPENSGQIDEEQRSQEHVGKVQQLHDALKLVLCPWYRGILGYRDMVTKEMDPCRTLGDSGNRKRKQERKN